MHFDVDLVFDVVLERGGAASVDKSANPHVVVLAGFLDGISGRDVQLVAVFKAVFYVRTFLENCALHTWQQELASAKNICI